MAAGGLGRYLARRGIEAVLTLFLASVPVFAMVAALPGGLAAGSPR